MVTAAIAKGGGARPKIVGKPSRAAVAELRTRLGLPTNELAVIGDDLGMDVALGKIGRCGAPCSFAAASAARSISTRYPRDGAPTPSIDGVADLLAAL